MVGQEGLAAENRELRQRLQGWEGAASLAVVPEAGSTSAAVVGPDDFVRRLCSLESSLARLEEQRKKEGEDAAAALREMARLHVAEEGEMLAEVTSLREQLAAKDEEILALEESGKEEARAAAAAEEAWSAKVAAVEAEVARGNEELAASLVSKQRLEAMVDAYMAETAETLVQKKCVDVALEAAVTCMHALSCSPRRLILEKMQLERDLAAAQARVAELERRSRIPRDLTPEEALARFRQPDMLEFREKVSSSAGRVAMRMVRKLVELGHDPHKIANTPFDRLMDMYAAVRYPVGDLPKDSVGGPLATEANPSPSS